MPRNRLPPTVLIIDDDHDFRSALAALVRHQGYRVEESMDGVAALEKLRWGLRPRFILLDMQMRSMTGWEFRDEQRRDPSLAGIPVVAMTAGPWKDRDVSAFTQRMPKPLDLEHLSTVLARYR